MTPRKTILVAPALQRDLHEGLFALLAAVHPVDFVGGEIDDAVRVDGVIAWTRSESELHRLAARGVDALVIVPPSTPASPVPHGRTIFASPPWLHRCFHGRRLHEHGIDAIAALPVTPADEIACAIDGQPCWIWRQADPATLQIVGFEPPAVARTESLHRHFNRLHWLRLLPFLQFAKTLTRDLAWDPPPLRAAFIFDDPNLHWRSYGFLNFDALARHAIERNYHAAVATIPADGWAIHPQTAQVFQQHRAQLSLLMHGNDHDGAEFGHPLPGDAFERILAQGLRRIASFEVRSGLQVARVMAPPHGAFRVEAAGAMLRLGYDAVCVARSSLAHWNKSEPWPRAFGHNIVEFLGGGLPLIPRHVIGEGQTEAYVLAAFLDQPILPHGHHGDCSGHLETIGRAADAINSLGRVRWCDFTTLSRSDYETRREGDTLRVRMLARHVSLPPPGPEIRQLAVTRPWIFDNPLCHEALECRQPQAPAHRDLAPRESPAFPIDGLQSVELSSPPARPLDPFGTPPPPARVWPAVRRLIAESRDRLAPVYARRARGVR